MPYGLANKISEKNNKLDTIFKTINQKIKANSTSSQMEWGIGSGYYTYKGTNIRLLSSALNYLEHFLAHGKHSVNDSY